MTLRNHLSCYVAKKDCISTALKFRGLKKTEMNRITFRVNNKAIFEGPYTSVM